MASFRSGQVRYGLLLLGLGSLSAVGRLGLLLVCSPFLTLGVDVEGKVHATQSPSVTVRTRREQARINYWVAGAQSKHFLMFRTRRLKKARFSVARGTLRRVLYPEKKICMRATHSEELLAPHQWPFWRWCSPRKAQQEGGGCPVTRGQRGPSREDAMSANGCCLSRVFPRRALDGTKTLA